MLYFRIILIDTLESDVIKLFSIKTKKKKTTTTTKRHFVRREYLYTVRLIPYAIKHPITKNLDKAFNSL